MIEIIPNLYLGTVNDVKDVEQLKLKNVKALVTCCTNFEFPQKNVPEGYKNLRIELEDIGIEPISSYFEIANDFIDSFISKNIGVLVYCCYGISRSCTITLAYLMNRKNLNLKEAFNLIMQKKCIAPNIGFMEQLCEYEKNLKKESTFSSQKYIKWFTSEKTDRNGIIDFST